MPYPAAVLSSGAFLQSAPPEDVELAGERVRPAPERGRIARPEQRSLRHHDVEQRVEAVVEEDLGIVDHDQVDPDEHLEHALGEVEVDRSEGLGVGARPVEEGVLALPPDRELHLVRAVAEPVVVDVVDEGLRLLRDRDGDEELHRVVGAVEERLQRGEVGLLPEPVAELDHAPLARPAAGHDGEQVGAVHLGVADVVEDQPEDVLLHLAALDDLEWGDDDPLLEDRLRPGGQRARERPARVHLVAELRRPADELVVVEDRHEHEPVVRVRDRGGTLERVRGQDHVPGIDAAIPVLHHLVDVGAELAHDHAAARVGDHRELVVLLPDDRAHRGAEEHGVHLVPCALERPFDDVERDGVDLDAGRDLGDLRLLAGDGRHRLPYEVGLMRMLKLTSTSAA